MMKAVAALALLSGVSAFTATTSTRSTTALNSVFEDYQGAIGPLRQEFKFDPLKLSETYSPLVPWFRETELRHGRTAMLAVVGFISTDFWRLPGDMYSFESIPKTIDAHDALLKTGPMYQLLLWIGLFDMVVTAPACVATMNGEREAGDYGLYGPFMNDGNKVDFRDSELLHGRLAMCAIGGIATQSIVTGHGFPYV